MATALTPALIDAFADAARRGIPVTTTCQLLQVPDRTFKQWCQDADLLLRPNGTTVGQEQRSRAVALVTAIQRARAEREAELVAEIANYQDKSGTHDWRASAFLLTHGPSRQNWFEHKQSSQTITVEHHPAHTTVRELGNDELLALAEGHPDTSENR